MEDLLMFSEHDLQAVWGHSVVIRLELDPLYRTKFMKAFRRLKDEALPAEGAEPENIRYVVISSKEQDALDEMRAALTE